MLGKPELEAVNLVPANILVSLDSLIVSMAIVMLGMPQLRATKLCAAFLVFDGIATLTGLSIHGPFAPALFSVYLVLLLALIVRSPLRSGLWAPALCSLDNLLAGIAAKPGHGSDLWQDALTAAFTSGILALVGIAIASAIAKRAPGGWNFNAGLVLLIAAICL